MKVRQPQGPKKHRFDAGVSCIFHGGPKLRGASFDGYHLEQNPKAALTRPDTGLASYNSNVASAKARLQGKPYVHFGTRNWPMNGSVTKPSHYVSTAGSQAYKVSRNNELKLTFSNAVPTASVNHRRRCTTEIQQQAEQVQGMFRRVRSLWSDLDKPSRGVLGSALAPSQNPRPLTWSSGFKDTWLPSPERNLDVRNADYQRVKRAMPEGVCPRGNKRTFCSKQAPALF